MWKPKPSKSSFFSSCVVHLKFLPRVSHDLADHKNCIWDNQINFQRTFTGQIRSSFEAQLNSPAELRQGNAWTCGRGIFLRADQSERSLSRSKDPTTWMCEKKLTSPKQWSLPRWTWEHYLTARYCWLYSYSRWPRRREVSCGTVTLRSFPSPTFLKFYPFPIFQNTSYLGVFKYGAGHRKVRWHECLVIFVPWHQSHPQQLASVFLTGRWDGVARACNRSTARGLDIATQYLFTILQSSC